MQAHRDDPTKKGTIITTGLWRYTRHPNYFGECLLWWGIYVIACGQQDGEYKIFSPIFITLLIRFVSGVAMLERKQKKKAAFRVYMMETSAFFPWWYKTVAKDQREVLMVEFEAEIKKEEEEAAKKK